MTLAHGASIITDGLLMSLDAANPRSYVGSGTAWNDLSGQKNNGTLVLAPTFNASNLGYFTFNGTSQYVSTNYVQTSVTNYTIDVWFNTTNAAIQSSFVQDRGYGPGQSITVGIGPVGTSSFGQVFIAVDSNSLIIQIATVSTTYNDGNWHNVVGVFLEPSGLGITTNALTLYMDGVAVNTTTSGIAQLGSTNSPLTGLSGTAIGYHQAWGTYFSGSISAVKIYNQSLNAAQAAQNFNALRGRYGL